MTDREARPSGAVRGTVECDLGVAGSEAGAANGLGMSAKLSHDLRTWLGLNLKNLS